jgi:hypothetical protein
MIFGRMLSGMLFTAAVVLARSPIVAVEPPVELCCTCDCDTRTICAGPTTDCASACEDLDGCEVTGSAFCPPDEGVIDGCAAVDCQPLCIPNTPSSTPTATATSTATATATSTQTATNTATCTNTPVPNGGMCRTTTQCAPGLQCVNSVCQAPQVAPASSPTGLMTGLLLLAAIAALALRRGRVR